MDQQDSVEESASKTVLFRKGNLQNDMQMAQDLRFHTMMGEMLYELLYRFLFYSW